MVVVVVRVPVWTRTLAQLYLENLVSYFYVVPVLVVVQCKVLDHIPCSWSYHGHCFLHLYKPGGPWQMVPGMPNMQIPGMAKAQGAGLAPCFSNAQKWYAMFLPCWHRHFLVSTSGAFNVGSQPPPVPGHMSGMPPLPPGKQAQRWCARGDPESDFCDQDIWWARRRCFNTSRECLAAASRDFVSMTEMSKWDIKREAFWFLLIHVTTTVAFCVMCSESHQVLELEHLVPCLAWCHRYHPVLDCWRVLCMAGTGSGKGEDVTGSASQDKIHSLDSQEISMLQSEGKWKHCNIKQHGQWEWACHLWLGTGLRMMCLDKEPSSLPSTRWHSQVGNQVWGNSRKCYSHSRIDLM